MIDLESYLKDQSKTLLGSGAFGTVYKWTNNNTQQVLAVKEINGSKIEDKDQFNNLKLEIEILKKIKSPNIVQFIDVQQTQYNLYCIFMEYCDGGDLQKRLEQEKQLSEDNVKKLIAEFLSGYLQLLINYVIHRDIKPANIFIQQNIYKIADFGLSRYLENSQDQMLNSIKGTQFYASPQIHQEQQYTTKTDVWSFGIILYQCIYGKLPFYYPENVNIQQFFKDNQLRYPDQPEVSQQLKDLISKCLVVEEDNRISWWQLMKDPYILEFFQEFVKLEKDIYDQEEIIIQNFIKKYQNNNILDINIIFQKYGQEQKLNLEQFSLIIKDINPQLSKFYIEFIYNNIVIQKNKEISKQDFKFWLTSFKSDKLIYQNQDNNEDNPIPISIYKGRQKNRIEEVALKIIPLKKISEKKVDIEIMKRLKSPHLVKIFDLKEFSDEIYLILEYCEGDNLQKFYQTEKQQLSEKDVQELLAGLLDALLELHYNDIGYRQLDPSHIIIKQRQVKQVKLINNFIHVRKVNNSQNLLATVNFDFNLKYLAPEMKKDETKYNVFKVDIYALGILLLDCVWTDNPSYQMANNDDNSQIIFPEDIAISKELQQIILQCIEQDEAKRISLSELLRDPYIIKFYDKFLHIEQEIKKKEQQIIQIIQNNHSIDDLFVNNAEQNEQQGQEIDLNQFSTIIRQLYQQELVNFEIEYIFDKINSKRQSTINRESLKNWINSQQLQIPKNFQQEEIKQIPFAINKLLIPAIRKYNTDVQLLFDVFEAKNDKKPLGYMTYEGFKEIITNVKKSTEDNLIQEAFLYFDKKQEKTIIEKDFIEIITRLK